MNLNVKTFNSNPYGYFSTHLIPHFKKFFEGLVITMERLVIDASTTKALLKLELEHVGRGPCSINLCSFKYFVKKKLSNLI